MEAENKVHDILKKCCQKHGSIPIIKKMKGFLLDNRYMISKKLNEGAFGQIYSGYDLQAGQKPIVLKFSKNHSMNDQEFNALAEIGQRASSSGVDFVETYAKGKALVLDRELRNVKHFSHLGDEEMMKAFDNQVWSYIVQEQLGETLESHLFAREEAFSPACCYKIGLQLLEQIRLIHEAGYTFNDIKLDNILVGCPKTLKEHKDYLHQIKMIDFGLAMKYQNETGEHIPATKERFFQGNLIFASPHCFNLITHSRRDDLISLAYLLLYLIDGDLVFLTKEDESQAENADNGQFNQAEFQRIKALKNKLTPEMLCESAEARTFLPFLEEVFSLEFAQAPDYTKLRNMLLTCLAKEGKKFDNIYDWNEEYESAKLREGAQVKLNFKQDPEMDLSDDTDVSHGLERANENQAAMKKALANQEDAEMNAFDKDLVSFSNPHGMTKQEFQQWAATGALNQVSSPTAPRPN